MAFHSQPTEWREYVSMIGANGARKGGSGISTLGGTLPEYDDIDKWDTI